MSTTAPTDLAARLLDAQVQFVLDELTGDRLAEVVARDVDDLLELAGRITVADLADAEHLKGALRRGLERIGGSELPAEVVGVLSDAIYDLSASEEYNLGDVVERDPVEALVVKVLGMNRLHDRAMERMADSPLVASVAQRFVTKIVSDFIAQNRQMAEKLPGAKSLFSLGSGAVNRVRNVSIIGEAADRGTAMAMKRTNAAMRELIREAPLRGAAMELWDLHADEPVSDLREYLSRQELRELALLVHELVTSAGGSEYVGRLLDECVDVLFAEYGHRDVASLLPELGITRDHLVEDLQGLLPPVIEAARATGELAGFVRARLEPFFASPATLAILAGEQPPADGAAAAKPARAKPAPAKAAAKSGAAKAKPKPAKKAASATD